MSLANAGRPITAAPHEARRTTRARWRGWRRSRPFWGGLLTILSGAILTLVPLASLRVAFIQGSTTAVSMLVGAVVLISGLTMWVGPRYSMFVGAVAIIGALAAIITTDVGGFLVGTLLGLIGGSLAIAWIPGKPLTETPTAVGPPGNSPGTG